MRNKSGLSSYLPAALILVAMFFCFQSSSYADEITLKWAPNTETDLAGYKIYYKRGFSGPPYNGVDIDQGTSPIYLTIDDPDDPYSVDSDNPEFLLTGLDDNDDYFLVVTAIDNEEPFNESGFSNEVNTLDSSSSGGSGYSRSSASSCFIVSSILSLETDYFKHHFILSACIIIALIGLICGAKNSSIKPAISSQP